MDKDRKTTEEPTKKIIEIDDSAVRGHLQGPVRGSVEETLNGYWMPKRMPFAEQNAMSEARIGLIRGPDTTNGDSTHRPAA